MMIKRRKLPTDAAMVYATIEINHFGEGDVPFSEGASNRSISGRVVISVRTMRAKSFDTLLLTLRGVSPIQGSYQTMLSPD